MDFIRKKQNLKPQDLKKNRLVVLIALGGTILAIFGVILYRERENLLGKILGPQVVITQVLTPTPPSVTPTPKFEKEEAQIKKLNTDLKGTYGVYVQDLITGESYGVNTDKIFTAASLTKLPVLLTLYREAEAGNLNLDTKYSLKTADKRVGAGNLQYKSAGTLITYRQMAELMGQQSDNTAFHILSEILGSQKIQRIIDDLGMKQTSFGKNETSPTDMGKLFYQLFRENLLVRDDRDELLSFLTKTIWEDRIPAGIPKEIRVAHKIGTEVGVISDAGIVFSKEPFILVILSEGVVEKEAKEILPKIAALVYKQINGPEAE